MDNENKILAADFTIPDTKDWPDLKDWRDLADKALRGADFDQTLVHKTVDGIPRGPLHTRADDPQNAGAPGQFPFVRGINASPDAARPWHLTQGTQSADPVRANADFLDDIEGGGSALYVILDPLGANGTAVHNINDLDRALTGIDLSRTPIIMQPCPESLHYAAMLLALAEARGVKAAQLSGSLGLSPIGQTVFKGLSPDTLPTRLGNTTQLAKWCSQNAPNLRTVTITASLIHEAGGSAALEIAFAAAGALSYLKAFNPAGLSPAQAAQTLLFDFSMEADVPLGIAKLRAARRVWANVMAACGCEDAMAAMHIHARTSRAMMSKTAPYTNVLRTSTAAFAAIAGGAQYVSVEPHDLALGTNTPAARRIARNVQIVLKDETHAGMVADPTGGAYAIEALSDEVAKAAWALFQGIQGQGGLAKAALSGWLGDVITQQRNTLLDEVKSGKRVIVGVNAYVQKDETPISPAISPAAPTPPKPPSKGTPFPTDFSVDKYIQAAADMACVTRQTRGDPIADFLPIRLCAAFEDPVEGGQ